MQCRCLVFQQYSTSSLCSKDISKASDELVDSSKEEMQNLRAENEQLKQRIEEERESKRALEEKLKHVETTFRPSRKHIQH
jgi:septal ring factor EnvC (AmiA/AmiB activator)